MVGAKVARRLNIARQQVIAQRVALLDVGLELGLRVGVAQPRLERRLVLRLQLLAGESTAQVSPDRLSYLILGTIFCNNKTLSINCTPSNLSFLGFF